MDRTSAETASLELSVDRSLIADATTLGIDVSAVAEEALRRAVGRERARCWVDENRAAIEANNARIEREGLWSDGLRSF